MDNGIIFRLSNQNSTQKLGFFGSVATALLFLFLHFPFAGYTTGYSPNIDVTKIVVSPECKAFRSSKDFQGSGDDALKLDQLCANEWNTQLLRTVELPFSQWTSNEPVIDWFGNIIHLVASILFVLLLGSLWIWTFKSKHET